jgi:hypothetical protein
LRSPNPFIYVSTVFTWNFTLVSILTPDEQPHPLSLPLSRRSVPFSGHRYHCIGKKTPLSYSIHSSLRLAPNCFRLCPLSLSFLIHLRRRNPSPATFWPWRKKREHFLRLLPSFSFWDFPCTPPSERALNLLRRVCTLL